MVSLLHAYESLYRREVRFVLSPALTFIHSCSSLMDLFFNCSTMVTKKDGRSFGCRTTRKRESTDENDELCHMSNRVSTNLPESKASGSGLVMTSSSGDGGRGGG